MHAALQTVKIDLDSAVKFYTDPQFHVLLLRAAQQVAAYAGEILAYDNTLVEADRQAFEQHMAASACLCGVSVNRADDDSPVPAAGVILDRAGTAGDQYVWVSWDAGEGREPATRREAIDDLIRAGGGAL